MAGELGIVIAFDQTKELVRQSKLKLEALKALINASEIEMSLVLKAYTNAYQQLTQQKQDLAKLELSQKNLIIERNRLSNELERLNQLQALFNKTQAVISKLKNVQSTLYTDDDLLGTLYDFYGANWYLPESFISLKELEPLMAWDEDDSDKWAEIFEYCDNYHQPHQSGISLAYLFFETLQSYVAAPIFSSDSPRQILLTEINGRIAVLDQKDVDYSSELQKTNALVLENQTQIALQTAQLKQAEKEISEEQKVIETLHSSAKQAQQHLFSYIYAKKFVKQILDFDFIVSLRHNWIDFLSKPKPILDKGNISKTYEDICLYQIKLDSFIKNQKEILEQHHYAQLRIHINSFEQDTFEEDESYKPLFKLKSSVEELLDEFEALREKYIIMHDDYFAKHKALKVQEQASLDAQKRTLKEEIKTKDKKLRIYLGDEYDEGDLSKYIKQRSQTYWWYDLFTCFLSNSLYWAIGYVADKTFRTNYINSELRPALKNYELTGNNEILASLLCSSTTPFFKPRTREPHSYCLTLDSMLNNIRCDFLSKEQLEAYKNANDTEQLTTSLL